MIPTADQVVQLALKEVGYLEKKTADLRYLFDKTANAGSNNFTKYAYELDNVPGFYFGKKNGFAWCDVWFDDIIYNACGKNADDARALLCQPKNSYGAGVEHSYKYYKSAGRLSMTPSVGDQIFFKSASYSYAHTGLVYKVDASRVYTIEGNASTASGVTPNGGGVVQKSYLRTYKNIIGYGHPAYSEGTEPYIDPIDHYAVKDMQTALNASYRAGLTVDGIFGTKTQNAVKNHLVKYGKTGRYVKWIQQRLTDIGYRGTMGKPDGIFGSKTKKAVIAFQKAQGLVQDGIVGLNTISRMIRKP